MANETPRNSLSLFRRSKMLELEKANAELIAKNNEYEKAIHQLRQDLKSLQAQTQHKELPTQPQTLNQQGQPYETDEEELEAEIGRFNRTQEPQGTTDKNQEWTTVKNKKKRVRDSPNIQQTKTKQNMSNSYWLGTVTSNRFEELTNNDNVPDNLDSLERPCKPPPIFVDKVDNINPLLLLLNQLVKGQYDVKTIKTDLVKILPKTIESYKIIVAELDKKKTEFYTYKPKTERGFKVIMRGMHPSTDTEMIKEELLSLGHEVTHVWNIKNKSRNISYPLFEIEMKTNSNNKDIYSVKNLMYCKVSFEPPKPKKSPPQCSNCQQYGHTKSFCRRPPKCIKCAGSHPSKLCERQQWGDQVKCVLCSGNHPANYKGCKVFKQLNGHQNNILPRRDVNVEDANRFTQSTNGETYASVSRINNNQQENTNQSRQPETNSQFSSLQEVPQMLGLLQQLLQQMTHLIINISSKITKN